MATRQDCATRGREGEGAEGFVATEAPGGFLQAMGIYNDALAAGKTRRHATLLALDSGARETAITLAFGRTGPSGRGSWLGRFALGGISEIPEELIQLWAQTDIQQANNPNYRITEDAVWDTIFGAGAVGGGMAAAHGVSFLGRRKLTLEDAQLRLEQGNDAEREAGNADWSARLRGGEQNPETAGPPPASPRAPEPVSETQPHTERTPVGVPDQSASPIRQAISRLKPKEQMVLVGAMLGKPLAKIGRALGLKAENTAIAFHVAIEKARRWLQTHFGVRFSATESETAPDQETGSTLTRSQKTVATAMETGKVFPPPASILPVAERAGLQSRGNSNAVETSTTAQLAQNSKQFDPFSRPSRAAARIEIAEQVPASSEGGGVLPTRLTARKATNRGEPQARTAASTESTGAEQSRISDSFVAGGTTETKPAKKKNEKPEREFIETPGHRRSEICPVGQRSAGGNPTTFSFYGAPRR